MDYGIHTLNHLRDGAIIIQAYSLNKGYWLLKGLLKRFLKGVRVYGFVLLEVRLKNFLKGLVSIKGGEESWINGVSDVLGSSGLGLQRFWVNSSKQVRTRGKLKDNPRAQQLRTRVWCIALVGQGAGECLIVKHLGPWYKIEHFAALWGDPKTGALIMS